MKVLLRERKRHIARRIAALSSGGGGPPQHPDLAGVPPPQPLGWGTPQTWDGVPPHHPDLAEVPPHPWDGVPPPPPSRPGWHLPPPQTRDGVPPLPSRHGWGTPPPPPSRPGWGTPHLRPEMGYPPPPHHPDLDGVPPPYKCEQTKNITFPHPSNAGGNKEHWMSKRCLFTSVPTTSIRTAKLVRWLHEQTVWVTLVSTTSHPKSDHCPANVLRITLVIVIMHANYICSGNLKILCYICVF